MNDRSQNLKDYGNKRQVGRINNWHIPDTVHVHGNTQDQLDPITSNHEASIGEYNNIDGPTLDNHNIWVRNLSSTPLTDAEQRFIGPWS